MLLSVAIEKPQDFFCENLDPLMSTLAASSVAVAIVAVTTSLFFNKGGTGVDSLGEEDLHPPTPAPAPGPFTLGSSSGPSGDFCRASEIPQTSVFRCPGLSELLLAHLSDNAGRYLLFLLFVLVIVRVLIFCCCCRVRVEYGTEGEWARIKQELEAAGLPVSAPQRGRRSWWRPLAAPGFDSPSAAR